MQKKRLIILTHRFPVSPGEEFLNDEIKVISEYFDEIVIYPDNLKDGLKSIHQLPVNVTLAHNDYLELKVSKLKLVLKVLPVLLKEFSAIQSKKLFFSLFKFNLSLLKQCYLKACNIIRLTPRTDNAIIYSYWCDDLALTGAFCKKQKPEIVFISRAHGFDVFEEQSDFRHIFFRHFHLSMLDRLWAVSQAGAMHLKQRNPEFKSKINYKYLGIQSDEKICFENTSVIRIVTCSHIRSIKRLELLVQALKLVKTSEVEWHVIGGGPDLDNLKELSKQLPLNCRMVFHGHLTIEEIHGLYGNKHFDFLVSVSSSEALPVSMMEAISHGIPVLSTDVGGCSEIVNETTGVLIPVDFSAKELIHIIENCKNGNFNELHKRQAITRFWKTNFFSEVNYKMFAEDLLTINTN